MAPILLTKCKTKPFSAIGMIVFGISLIGLGTWLIYTGGSWWWLILILFGIFCFYHWLRIMIKGSMTLVLYVDSDSLYVSYNHTKDIMSRLDEIKNLEYYNNQFQLNRINRFWRYIAKTNGVANTDILYFQYEYEEQVLADLDYYGASITDEELQKILHFLLNHIPNLQIGKAN